MENDYIANIRREYLMPKIEPSDFSENPFTAFKMWFDFALNEKIEDVNAMVLSTVDVQHKPHSRVVLLKDISEAGLTFFTNYNSHKGENLAQNPSACLNFFWQQLARQIRVEGTVEKVSEETNDAYFQSRPRLSQAGAIVSNQSAEIDSRTALDESMQVLMQQDENIPLQRPKNWGGYCLIPNYFEFWQGRPGRVHDRIAYELKNGNWRKFRLSP
jgi:pyridoxamine 5'-phosphate oxidase